MSDKVKTVYIAGPITGDPDYKEKFAVASEVLREQGFIVCNPAVLMKSLVRQNASYKMLVKIGAHVAAAADALALLPGWEKSRGAVAELALFLDARTTNDYVYEFTMKALVPGIYEGQYAEKRCTSFVQKISDLGISPYRDVRRYIEELEDPI